MITLDLAYNVPSFINRGEVTTKKKIILLVEWDGRTGEEMKTEENSGRVFFFFARDGVTIEGDFPISHVLIL